MKPHTPSFPKASSASRYIDKFGRQRDPLPPDDVILAQLLTAAPLDSLISLIQDLMAESKEPGSSYAWYVTVALQRIHSVHPAALKARRAALRLVKRAGVASVECTQQSGIDFAGDLVAGMVSNAKAL